MSAFKIACLAYKPSPVSLEGEVYSRKELSERRGRELRECWDRFRVGEPWNEEVPEGGDQHRTQRDTRHRNAYLNDASTTHVRMQDEEVDPWEGMRGHRRLQLVMNTNPPVVNIAGLSSSRASFTTTRPLSKSNQLKKFSRARINRSTPTSPKEETIDGPVSRNQRRQKIS